MIGEYLRDDYKNNKYEHLISNIDTPDSCVIVISIHLQVV